MARILRRSGSLELCPKPLPTGWRVTDRMKVHGLGEEPKTEPTLRPQSVVVRLHFRATIAKSIILTTT